MICNNAVVVIFKIGIESSYFSSDKNDEVESVINGTHKYSGRGIVTTQSRFFTLDNFTIESMVKNNTIIGIWCNNWDGCFHSTASKNLVVGNLVLIEVELLIKDT